jgi:queuine tRNA-ribosyltransferase
LRIDPWLLDYTRVTVPTFCLLQDALDRTSKNNTNNSNISNAVTVTSQHVMLWTANGRTPLTPSLYHQAATAGLQSQISVSLFDTPPAPVVPTSVAPEPTTTGTLQPPQRQRRKQQQQHFHSANANSKKTVLAIRRTQDFLSDFLFRQTQQQQQQQQQDALVASATTTAPENGTSTTAPTLATDRQIWAPYLVVDDDNNDDGENAKDASLDAAHDDDYKQSETKRKQALHTQQINAVLEKVKAGTVTGVALIGWQYTATSGKRKSVLQSVLQSVAPDPTLSSPPKNVVTVGVLSTNSLQQVLEAACAGVHVIGSRLPTVWAQAKKAFCAGRFLDSWKDVDIVTDRKRRRLDLDEPATTSASNNNSNSNNNNNNETNSSSASDDTLELDADGCVHLMPNANDDPTLHPWFHDKKPIQTGCSCLTCRTHSRSYIYHLVCAKELLAEILLFCHNLHAMLQVLREFQSAHDAGRALELYEYLLEQLPAIAAADAGGQ